MSCLIFKAYVYIEDENYKICYDDCHGCGKDCFEAVVKIIPVFRDDNRFQLSSDAMIHKLKFDTTKLLDKLDDLTDSLRKSKVVLDKLRRR